MNANDNGFVVVEIQYRLGAFGFIASAEVKKNGRLNAGLLDQRFALEWVQEHISKFGGDSTRVTLGGESSGAGSVFYHATARGGKEPGFFSNVSELLVFEGTPISLPCLVRLSLLVPTSRRSTGITTRFRRHTMRSSSN